MAQNKWDEYASWTRPSSAAYYRRGANGRDLASPSYAGTRITRAVAGRDANGRLATNGKHGVKVTRRRVADNEAIVAVRPDYEEILKDAQPVRCASACAAASSCAAAAAQPCTSVTVCGGSAAAATPAAAPAQPAAAAAAAASAPSAAHGTGRQVVPAFELKRATADRLSPAPPVKRSAVTGRVRAPARYASFSMSPVPVGEGVGFAETLAGFIDVPYQRAYAIPGYGGHQPRTSVLLKAAETNAVRLYPSNTFHLQLK